MVNKAIAFDEIKEGDKLPPTEIRMERDKYLAYNDLVKNINPIHADKGFANRLGYKDIVVAGVYTFSFIPKMIEDWAGGSGKVRDVRIKFHNPVYIEETIIQSAEVGKKVSEEGKKYIECEVSVEDGQGTRLTSATVTVDF